MKKLKKIPTGPVVSQSVMHGILLFDYPAKIQFVFGRFSEVHEFEKPNDKQALNLMNSCAVAVLEEIQDIIFAYGVSDEYRYAIFFSSYL